MNLNVETTKDGNRCNISLRGDVDAASAAVLREELTSLADLGYKDIVIDMQDVDFIDSSGIGVLMGAVLRAKRVGGSIGLRNVGAPILQIFELLGITEQFCFE